MQLSDDFLQFISQSTDAHIISDDNGIILHSNVKCAELFDHQLIDLIGKPITVLMPEEFVEKHNNGMHRHKTTGKGNVVGSVVELKGKKKSGYVFPIELSLSKIIMHGKTYFCGILRDISDRKMLEEELNLKVNELDVLFKEVHHRVKNNLQIIISLCNMHASRTISEEAKIELGKFSSRVYSIALIHEKIYQAETSLDISLKEYFYDLLSSFRRSFDTGNLKYDFECAEVHLDIQKMLPLGLLFIELITNSFTHGFTNISDPIIGLKVEKKNELLHFKIYDNGNGYDSNISSKGLGNKLIKSFLKQTQAQNVVINTTEGVSYEFTVELY